MDYTAAPTAHEHLAGDSKPTSYLGGDTSHTDLSHQAPEYLVNDDATNEGTPVLQRSGSQMSQSATYIPSRGNTLKKKGSLRKTGSVKRNESRRSSYAGSVRSMKLGEKEKHEPEEYNSAFYCPIPTTSSPTELLANRFQAWRLVLKNLINYFRELHKGYETRSKSLISASNMINNTAMPVDFLNSGGIGDAALLMRDFHKLALNEASKARDLENEVIAQLTGLRSDLSQKIKEIKGLSGDFKNSVHKEQDNTRKAVNALQEALSTVDRDATAAAGRGDPFLIKLGVERQLEHQIEEENYLHRAFLNLEASGRELESIVVGEIQKAYNVLAGILKRDADSSYDTAEKLREGPLTMSRDHEWDAYVTNNTNMVDPRHPLRQVKNITYEGKDHPAAIEVKSGMLERKSKYLKNYTPGWYILSPTHLHEFKSADQIPFQTPVMSLYLPEQKLGSHSEPGSSSHKFMVKGRQTGSMHRGHTWIFRAETHDTMMAWFSDITQLTEKRGEARNEFVRRTHARSVSRNSRAASVGSGDSQMDEDDADKVAFSGEQSVRGLQADHGHDGAIYAAGGATGSGVLGDDSRSDAGWRPPQRPQPGGRFPSEVNVTRGLQAPLSRSSGDSGDEHDREAIAAASTLPGSAVPVIMAADYRHPPNAQPLTKNENAGTISSLDNAGTLNHPGSSNVKHTAGDFSTGNIGATAVSNDAALTGATGATAAAGTGYTAGEHPRVTANPTGAEVAPDTQSQYHEWIDTAGAGLAGAGVGTVGATAVTRHIDSKPSQEHAKEETATASPAVPTSAYSSAPAAAASAIPIQPMSHGLDEPSRLTASAYQATTMPSSVDPADAGFSSTTSHRDLSNGGLIGSTDIRVPSGSGSGSGSGTGSGLASGSGMHYSTTTMTEPSTISSKGVDFVGIAPVPTESPTAVPPSSIPVSIYSTDVETVSRPKPVHSKSVQTISDLHIPGEFPRGADTPPRSAA